MNTLYSFYDYEITRPLLKQYADEMEGRSSVTVYPTVTDDFVGIEVEVENVHLVGANSVFWSVKEDGSLRNSGFEYVSHLVNSKWIGHALSRLHEHLTSKYNKDHQFTERTSVHIHLNMRDCPVDKLANFILIYLLAEDLLFEFVDDHLGTNRKHNVFCHSLKGSSFTSLAKFSDILCLEMDEQSLRSWLYGLVESWPKYAALNLNRLSDLGTVEFRHLGGTIDVPLIMEWINLILRMKKTAMSWDRKELIELVTSLNTSSMYESVMSDLFGTEVFSISKYISLENMEDNVIKIKELSSRPNYKAALKEYANSPMNKYYKKTSLFEDSDATL